jgi:hypothetical protein
MRDLPGYWAVRGRRAVVVHPAGWRRPHRPLPVTTSAAFRGGKPLGTREKQVFGAAFPTAQRLAYLRINRDVATPIARLATGLPGSALAGRDLHPLDDKPNLRKTPQDFLLLGQHCLVALPRTLLRGLSTFALIARKREQ